MKNYHKPSMTNKSEKKPTSRKVVDWDAIEREYRAGQLSVVEIGRQFGVSHTAINKRAKKNGWTRDLTEKVRKEVSARLVSEEVSNANTRETIELAATRGVQLVREHRSDIGGTRNAVTKMIEELHTTLSHTEEIEDDIIEETKDDKDGKRRARMLAAVALPSRANVASTLAAALKTLIPLERQAFNLDDKKSPPDGSPDDPVNVKLDDAGLVKIRDLLG